MKPRALNLVVAAALLTSACGGPSSDDGKVGVVTAFYPLEFVAAQVGGDAVSTRNLVRPGVEPHDLDPSPEQVAAVADADLVVYLKGFQPQIDDVVKTHAADRALDVATVEKLHGDFTPLEEGASTGEDPHVWLDPARLAAIAEAVAGRLATHDGANASAFKANAAGLRTRLQALDAEYRAGLETCERRAFVVSHNAFGYLASRYGLTQQAIAGLSPDAEPSAQRIAELTDLAKADGVTVIFFERLVSDKTARTLAREVGAKTDVLDPIEGLEEGSTGDYFSVMRSNLAKLRNALGCT